MPGSSDNAAAVVRSSPGAPPLRGVAAILTALQSLIGSGVALFVPAADRGTGLDISHAGDTTIPAATITGLRQRVEAWVASAPAEATGEALPVVGGWQLLVAESRAAAGERAGVVAMARPAGGTGGWSASESSAVQIFAGLCGSWIADAAGPSDRPAPIATPPSPAVSLRRLDALVTGIAVELMSVTAETLDDAMEWMLRVLSEFFQVDTSYLRRNDIARNMTVLVAEWPRRRNVPDPDPLGEVTFGTDPVFDATRDLSEPFVIRPTESPGSYQERIKQGSGIGQVSMAMVPLLRNRTTVGVLGFVKFGDRPWDAAETNALQAVASLMVQLEARIDAEQRLQHLAYHDELTGLPNRRAVLEELEHRLEPGAGHTAALVVDLDRFKALNDFLGHGAGDRLLETVGERLRGATADGDFVARLAGDEFVVLLDRPAGRLEALAVAEGLLELVAAPLEISGHHVRRTGSAGLVLADGSSVTADELLAHGDAALRLAKARGGNQVVVFDHELRASVRQRSDTELQLRDAIDDGGLVLYYQPEVDLRNGELLAVEALVRWNHPERGVLPAGSFINVAEDTGLIVDLGRWVLAEACRQMAVWRRDYAHLRFTMRVNMSPAQLATRNIVQLVADALESNHLPGRLICFEITEHAVMQDVEQALQVLHDLKSLGVSLAIDDFGTGYSSMSQLKRLPVDALKIDQTFVAGLCIDGGDRAIVDATVRLAHAFGLEAVAEGVETAELVDELLGLGCYRAQGFLLSRPKPPADLVPVLLRGGIDPAAFGPSPSFVPARRSEVPAPGRAVPRPHRALVAQPSGR